MHFPQTSTRRITINKMNLQEAGTFNPLHFRPYQTHVDPTTMETITQRAEQSVGHINNPAIFAGIGAAIVSPMSTPGQQISIPYGWSERRIRFAMEMSIENSLGGTEIYHYQGYTNYLGVQN